MWKRISAYLFDLILLVIAVAGFAFLLSVMLGFDKHNAALEEAYARYEKEYGVVFDISQEEFMQKSEVEQKNWNDAYQALIKDTDAMYSYNMVINLTLVISTLAILLAYLVLEFIVPIKLGNGQTLGKKIFGIAVMRTDSVKVTAPLLFIRTILGKYTIETMIPILLIYMIFFNGLGMTGLILIVLILVLQIGLMIGTHNNAAIHDVMAKTVAVDLASQMIFDTHEQLLEMKGRYYELYTGKRELD